MMKKAFLTYLALLFMSISVLADGNESLFELANQKYSAGEYSEAIKSYEEILSTGYFSASLYYNLGNAYYKSNKLTLAILNYERALLLSPGDEDIVYNLDIANQLVADKINVLPEFFVKKWMKQIRMGLSPDSWAVLSIISFLLSSIFILMFFFMRSRAVRKISLIASVVSILFSVSTLLMGLEKNKQLSEHNTAIVFSPSVTAKSSPDESGTDLFVLHEGVKVWIIDQVNDWLEIELADGNKAWIPENSLERI